MMIAMKAYQLHGLLASIRERCGDVKTDIYD